MFKSKILDKLFTRFVGKNVSLVKAIKSAPTYNCSVFERRLNGTHATTRMQINENVSETALKDTKKVTSKYPINHSSVHSCAARKPEFTQEEKEVFNDILAEYRTLKPVKIDPKCRTYDEVSEQINGDKLSLSHWFENEQLNGIGLTTGDGRRIFSDFKTLYGDKTLQKEFETFLNGKQPSIESFNEFVTLRNMRYLRDNEIYSLKGIRTSMDKGKEIERFERQHHDKVQEEYNKIWRNYPTDQFYRVAGIDELSAILRGETIISKNSVARYGRPCVDITPNGYYHDIFYGEQKVRIAFKRKDSDGGWHERLTSKIRPFREENQHYQIPSYDYKDVDFNKLTYWNGSDWEPLDVSEFLKS